jgi:hypothetical protein
MKSSWTQNATVLVIDSRAIDSTKQQRMLLVSLRPHFISKFGLWMLDHMNDSVELFDSPQFLRFNLYRLFSLFCQANYFLIRRFFLSCFLDVSLRFSSSSLYVAIGGDGLCSLMAETIGASYPAIDIGCRRSPASKDEGRDVAAA